MKTPIIWMPVYVADVDTVAKGLTPEQEGIFHRLMRVYWVDGALPGEDRIPVFLGLSTQKWRASRDVVLAAFQSYCERTDMNWQREKSAQIAHTARERAKRGAAARWKHQVDEARRLQPNGACLEQCSSNAPSPSPSQKGVFNGEQTSIQGAASTYDVELNGEGRASTGRPVTPRHMGGFGTVRPNGKLRH